MQEPPRIESELMLACLRQSYGVAATSISFLPLGNDSSAWVYRVEGDDGRAYLLKLKQGAISQAALALPRYLRDQGIAQIVAPQPGLDGALAQTLEPYRVSVYPFIEGRPGWEQGLTPAQWAELGGVLARLHASTPPPELLGLLPRESFRSRWLEPLQQMHHEVATHSYAEPFERQLAELWREHHAQVEAVIARTEALGAALRRRAPALALCHADIHTANVMIDAQGRLFVIDWDDIILAPRERDLMFILDGSVGAGVRPEHEQAFLLSYGAVAVDQLALAYYRNEWVVQDLGDYGERVLRTPGLGAVTLQASLDEVRAMFAPGGTVESALRAEWIEE